jgi:hypothetical protein
MYSLRLVSSPAAAGPSAGHESHVEMTMGPSIPVSQHRDVFARSRQFMELGAQSGNRLFLPSEALLRQTHPTHPQYTGCVVAQTPLEYAIALFETGGNASAAGNAAALVAGFLIVVAQAVAPDSLRSFARHLAEYTLTATPGTTGIALAVNGRGTVLSVNVPPAAQSTPAEFLHGSPYLRLHPGDLGKRLRAVCTTERSSRT